MSESGLLSFQLGEILIAAKYIVSAMAIALGAGLWIRANRKRRFDISDNVK